MGDLYRKSRMIAFVRDEFKCQYPGCKRNWLNHLTAHHLTPRVEGGRSLPDNLVTVCLAHHKEIHQTPAAVAQFRAEWLARRARPVGMRWIEDKRGELRRIEVAEVSA